MLKCDVSWWIHGSLGGIEFEATGWIIGLDKYWISILLLILYNYDLLEIFKDLVF